MVNTVGECSACGMGQLRLYRRRYQCECCGAVVRQCEHKGPHTWHFQTQSQELPHTICLGVPDLPEARAVHGGVWGWIKRRVKCFVTDHDMRLDPPHGLECQRCGLVVQD